MKDNNVKVLEELRTYNSSLDKEKHQFFLQVSEQILSDIIEKLGDKPLPDYYSPDAFRKLSSMNLLLVENCHQAPIWII